MLKKCMWCAAPAKDLKEVIVQQADKRETVQVCGEQCEHKLREYIMFVMNNVRRLFGLLLVVYIAGMALVFSRIKIDGGGLGCFVLFGGSGLVLVRYPFVTGQTMRWLGTARAILSARVLGVVNIAIGLFFWWRLSLLAT